MERQLFFSGNEAIAHGAVRAGAGFACGYPGTPSTEILEATARLDGIHSEWCVNEKVALETAVGASLAGVRTLVTMKHVGLNVAADPFMTLSLTGVNGGLVVVSADDPGMHSSQNEQDNRNYARFAKVPMLEPSDSQEAYDFVAEAFALSEEFDTPVLLRTTTRISHGRGQVLPRVPVEVPPREYARDISKYVMVPQYARQRNRLVLERLAEAAQARRGEPAQRARGGHRRTSASSPRASPTRTPARRSPRPGSSSWACRTRCPTPRSRALYEHVSRVAVVEELDPFIEEQVRALGLPVIGKAAIPADGELDQEIVFRALEPTAAQAAAAPAAGHAAGAQARRAARAGARPARAPAGALPRLLAPLRVTPRCARQQARADGRHRLLHARRAAAAARPGQLPVHGRQHRHDGRLQQGARAARRRSGVIGDSTFFHSGITPLIDAFYNEVEGMVVILDNRTTAMTGHQGHPGRACTRTAPRARASTSRSSARASACAAPPSTPPTTRRSTRPSRPRPRRRGWA